VADQFRTSPHRWRRRADLDDVHGNAGETGRPKAVSIRAR
jgi:hypothetical protein